MAAAKAPSAAIPEPHLLADVGIRRNLLEDLALKILCLEGQVSLLDLADKMRLNFAVIQELFQYLRTQDVCKVVGMTGHVHHLTLTAEGRRRGVDLLAGNQYAGPAPVSLADYVKRIQTQSIRNVVVNARDLQGAFQDLVLDPQLLTQLGTAVVSGASIFLYGPTGTGKTVIATTLARVYPDEVWIPHAVEVDGQIITVYDSVVHERIDRQLPHGLDGRWVLCRRPRVVAGGEMTIEMLDLQFNPVTKFYAAPLQMKANNGVMVIDDFGRQRIRPEEILNRWIMPLDRGIDFLTLAGGRKLEIPFDVLVVFATNLDPSRLAEDAFLRRIQNKIKVDYATEEQFHGIFRSVCRQLELGYDRSVVDHLIGIITKELKEPLRACYPRDIIHQIRSAALYQGQVPHLSPETVAQACRTYFLSR